MSEETVICDLPAGAELDQPFRRPSGSSTKFAVYTKNEDGKVVRVPFGDPDMEIRRDDPARRKAFRERFNCDTDPGPKWKAKFWACRMWDDEPVSEITAMHATVTASFQTPGFEGKAPDAIVFFPKGVNTVNATRDGKPYTVTVNATVELAGMLNAQLQEARREAMMGTASRPFIDFGHKRDAAAAIPTEIYWDDEKGVMASVEWTKSGREAIEGKDFSYFSPEFLPDRNNSAALRVPGPIGGLVNTPAFQTIGPIAASLTEQESMKNIISKLKQFGVQITDDADETVVCSALEAKLTQDKNDLAAVKASLASFEKKEADAVAAALAAEAEKVVSAALADGKIKADAKETWQKAFIANRETVTAQLASIPAKADGHQGVVKTVTAAAADDKKPMTCSKAEFKAMTTKEKMDFSSKGGKISDS